MAYCPECGTETNETTGKFNMCSSQHICRNCNFKFDWWIEELEDNDDEE